MTDTNNKIRAVVLAALMVLSVFAGTVAFAGTASAASLGSGNSLSPTTVAVGTTNTHSVTLNATDVDTTDGNNTVVEATFPSALDISGAGVSNVVVNSGNVTGTANVGVSGQTLTVELVDDTGNGVASDTVNVSFDVTGVTADSVGSGDVTVDVIDDSTGSVTDQTLATVTVSSRAPSSSPATVYLGEENVDLTVLSGVNAGQPATFVSTTTGGSASVDDGASADITAANDFEAGVSYNSSGNSEGQADLFVREPRVTDLTLYSGDNTDVDITDGSLTSEEDNLTVEAEWNFNAVEDVSLILENPNGNEININRDSNLNLVGSFQNSGDTVRLEGVDSLRAGTYTVTIEGEDVLDSASRSATFTIRDEEQTISLGSSSVTQGEQATMTVTGTPGAYGVVKIAVDDVDNSTVDNASAQRLFTSLDEVVVRAGTEDSSWNAALDDQYAFALVELGDDGEADVSLETNELETGSVDIEFNEIDTTSQPSAQSKLVTDALNASADADTTLSVEEKSINISSAPSVVRIGEEFDIEGTAAESDDVKAYARIDDDWVPLLEDADTAGSGSPDYSEDSVDTDGDFTITVDTGYTMNLPDSYRVAVVADPVLDDGSDLIDGSASDQALELTSTQYGQIDTKQTVTIRTVEGDLTAQLSSSTIASGVGDEVTLSGTALGQGNDVRVYVIGPRGNFIDEDGSTITSGNDVPTLDIDEEEFDEDFAAFDRRGTYTFIVVGQGRDGEYATDVGLQGTSNLPSGKTPAQALAIVRDEYSGAGVDDQVVELTLQAENPMLTLNDFTTNGQVAQGDVTISGTSNREDGTTVFIEVLGQNENVVASDEAEVNGSTGEWSTTIDMSDVETGTYTVRADDDEASASLEFELVGSISTPTETPEPDTDTPEPDTDTPEPDTDTPEPDTDTETTSTSTPGFGVIVALMALIAAALLAFRRD